MTSSYNVTKWINISNLVEKYKILLSLVIVFIFLSLVLGPSSFLVLFVCAYCGYQEYIKSKIWYGDKEDKIIKGISRKKIREDYRLFTRFFRYVYLVLFFYCLIIYGLYHLANISNIIRDGLWAYFEVNKNFYFYSGYLYDTIGRHYAVVATNNILRAEMLVHIYAVIFNSMVLLPLFFIPSCKVWFNYIYQFVIPKHSKGFTIFGIIFSLFLLAMMLWLAVMVFDAPHMKETRRWSYHILLDDKFLLNLIVIFAVVPISTIFTSNICAAYIYAFFKGKTKLINHKEE